MDPRGRGWIRAAAAAALLLGGAAPSTAQDPPLAAPSPEPTAERPGRLRLGPFYLSPTFHVGTVGLDTNVFYTATARRTDLTAVGGPGLEVVLPLRDSARIVAAGGLDYLFFLRTSSQRQLHGNGRGRLEWKTGRTAGNVEESYNRSYGRLGFEVDERVFQDQETTRAEFRPRLFGRFSLGVSGARGRLTVDTDTTYLGVDLHRTLSRDLYQAGAALEYSLTVKTSAVLEGDFQADRFRADPVRDGDLPRLMAGLRTDPTALVSGRALLGLRAFRRRSGGGTERSVLATDLDATLNISPRTRVAASFQRDLGYSALGPSSTPTLLTHTYGARLEKELTGRLDLRVFLRRTRFRSDGPIELVLAGDEPVRGIRDDTADEVGADLGYRFRQRLRVGMAAVYTERRSTIATFGIEGLLLGATVTYTP